MFMGPTGDAHLTLSVANYEEDKLLAFLNVCDENGKQRICLTLGWQGPELQMLDEQGQVIWSAP